MKFIVESDRTRPRDCLSCLAESSPNSLGYDVHALSTASCLIQDLMRLLPSCLSQGMLLLGF